MKPRLEAAPYTDEDCAVWRRVHLALPALSDPYSAIAHADRRDAELMLGLRDFVPAGRFSARAQHLMWAFYTVKLSWDASAERLVPSE